MNFLLENWGSVIRGVVIALVTGLVFFLAQSSLKKPLTDPQGLSVLKMPKVYEVIGWCAVLLFSSLLVIFSINSGGINRASIVFILFIGLGVIIIFSSRNKKITYSDVEIIDINWLGSEKRVIWNDIKKVTFGKNSQTLYLWDSEKKLSLHWHLKGFNHFLDVMKSKLDPALYEKAMENYQSVAKRMGL